MSRWTACLQFARLLAALACSWIVGKSFADEPVPAYPDHRRLMVWRDAAGGEHPVRSPADWQRRRAHILAGMQAAMGKLPDRKDLPPLDVQVSERSEQPGFTRLKLSFVAERRRDGSSDRVPAWLLLPAPHGDQRRPAMLALHQTVEIGKGEPVGVGGKSSLHYAAELARRGYVVLAPDYPSFGDYRYDFAADDFVSGSMKGIVNHLRAVDLLAERAEVDPQRIGVIGHSLGGHNALFAAAFDERLKVVVTSCGWTPFHDYYGGKIAGWTSDRYMPRLRDAYGLDPNKVPFDFYEVLAAIAPRAVFSNSPLHDDNFDVAGVRKAQAAAREVFELHDASAQLKVVYPDCGHDFPSEVRDQAYQFVDRVLKHSPSDATKDDKTPAPGWRAGVARTKITPRGPMWMSGYAARNRPAEGTLLDLWAKVLVLEDERGTRLALVTLDLLGLDRELSEAIAADVEKQHKLPRAHLALCCSHTHSGPVVGKNLRSAHFDLLPPDQRAAIERYSAILEHTIVELVGQAIGDLGPCQLGWTESTASFAVNRRTNREPEVPKLRDEGKLRGPVDHAVPVLAVRTPEGKLTATVFGYACHATVLDGYQWCGDYPGYAQAALEERHAGTTALFWAGCGGDQNPLPRRKVELAKDYGQQLAHAVEQALGQEMTPITSQATARFRHVELPFAKLPTLDELRTDAAAADRYVAARATRLLAEVEGGKPLAATYPYPVQLWTLGGQVRWVFLGGEVVVDYALRLKGELKVPGVWITAYANDVMAYIPSRRVLGEGGYEGGGAMVYYGLPSPWGPQVEEAIVGSVRQLAEKP
jgi:acetyl esterase/lipase